MARAEKSKRISVLNWMGTMLVCSIPGVNLIALILFIIFAKSPSKRSFAIASLLWIILLIALVCAAFLVFPEQISEFAAYLRGGDAVSLLVEPAN
jgi:uncharacterized membrane protein YqjE